MLLLAWSGLFLKDTLSGEVAREAWTADRTALVRSKLLLVRSIWGLSSSKQPQEQQRTRCTERSLTSQVFSSCLPVVFNRGLLGFPDRRLEGQRRLTTMMIGTRIEELRSRMIEDARRSHWTQDGAR